MYKMANNKENKQVIITKKIAKHGSQAIIIIPRILEKQLSPGTVAEIKINVLEDGKNEKIKRI